MIKGGIEVSLLRATALSALSLGLVSAFACSPDPSLSSKRPNIVLVCFDTLRADHLSIYGYARSTTPNIDRVFENAEVFDHAYSAATYTSASMVSLLSGLEPTTHGVRDFFQKLSPQARLLPDYLSEHGYQTAAIVSNTVLTDEALGFGSHFEYYDDFVDERELNRELYQRRASRTVDAALRWLTFKRDPERPHFLLLHLMDPHAPYGPPAAEFGTRFTHQGTRPLPESIAKSYQYLSGVTDALDYIDRYDEEIAYADQEMGRFFAAYEKLGLVEDAILIFTSDHGETLLERSNYFEHSSNLWSEVIRVPLLIRWPEGRARRVDRAVSLVDLAPTLLREVVGGDLPELQGVPFGERRERDFLFQEAWMGPGKRAAEGAKRSVLRNGLRWTFQVDENGVYRELWVTNLRTDPHEKDPQPWPETAERVRTFVRERLAAEKEQLAGFGPVIPGERPGAKPAPELEPHQRRALEALGYLQTTDPDEER